MAAGPNYSEEVLKGGNFGTIFQGRMSERYLLAGALRLDLHDERLWVGETPVAVGGRAFGLLRALMQASQTLVTKEVLLDTVWPDVTVSESVLTTAIKEVRKAIGDSARKPQWIETVHGRGYRFLQPVRAADALDAVPPTEPPAPPSPPARPPLNIPRPGLRFLAVLVLLLIALALVGDPRAPALNGGSADAGYTRAKSLAVLPFRDLSGDGSGRWFADGLTEEVLASIGRAPDLWVASQMSASDLADADPREIGRRLGVAHLLRGSVRRGPDRVRVRVELLRADDGFILWSRSYDRRPEDSITIQEDVAYRIARELKTVMDPEQLAAMMAAGTRSVEAYEAYLAGLSYEQRHFAQGDIELSRQAAAAFERASAADPDFAAAHWRSALYWFGNTTRIDSLPQGADLSDTERLARFLERVDRAVATSKDPVDRLRYHSAAAVYRLQFREAYRMINAYLDRRQSDIDAWEEMAVIAAYVGDRAGVARAAEHIHSHSMASGDPRSRAITLSVMAMRPEVGVRMAREQLRVRPDRVVTQYQAHRAMVWAGRPHEARQLLLRIRASGLPEHSKLLAALRQACLERRQQDAAAIAARIERDGELSDRWQAAQIMGEEARSAVLLRPLDTREGLPTLLQFMINPSFDPHDFPVLQSRLEQNGVPPRIVATMPKRCRRL